MALDRQPAYDAVYRVIRDHPPRTVNEFGIAVENARVWRAVEAALDAVIPAEAVEDRAPEGRRVPCPEGFHWIGQAFTACDRCGLPAWDHDGMAKLPVPLPSLASGEPRWVLDPWKPGEREACRRKWDPGYAARSGEVINDGV